MKYYCVVCHQEITGDDIEDRCTYDGEDCHANCYWLLYEREDTEEDIAAGFEYARQQAEERVG